MYESYHKNKEINIHVLKEMVLSFNRFDEKDIDILINYLNFPISNDLENDIKCIHTHFKENKDKLFFLDEYLDIPKVAYLRNDNKYIVNNELIEREFCCDIKFDIFKTEYNYTLDSDIDIDYDIIAKNSLWAIVQKIMFMSREVDKSTQNIFGSSKFDNNKLLYAIMKYDNIKLLKLYEEKFKKYTYTKVDLLNFMSICITEKNINCFKCILNMFIKNNEKKKIKNYKYTLGLWFESILNLSSVEILKIFLSKVKGELKLSVENMDKYCDIALRNTNIDFIKMLYENGITTDRLFKSACEEIGSKNLAQHLQFTLDNNIKPVAYKYDSNEEDEDDEDDEQEEYLIEGNYIEMSKCACLNDSIDVLELLIDAMLIPQCIALTSIDSDCVVGLTDDVNSCFEKMIINKCYRVIDYLMKRELFPKKNNAPFEQEKNFYKLALENGDVKMCRKMKEYGCVYDKQMCMKIIKEKKMMHALNFVQSLDDGVESL
jgi:hypothetical protein